MHCSLKIADEAAAESGNRRFGDQLDGGERAAPRSGDGWVEFWFVGPVAGGAELFERGNSLLEVGQGAVAAWGHAHISYAPEPIPVRACLNGLAAKMDGARVPEHHRARGAPNIDFPTTVILVPLELLGL